MKYILTTAVAAALAAAQTFTDCNPLETTCPPNPALGTSKEWDFTQGEQGQWSAEGGAVTYNPSMGAEFTVAKQGDAPLLVSDFYIMFGHVEWELQAAPGQGIVSSAVLQSDDLDEIDWEFLGGEPDTVQTNYFSKGDTSSYDREQTFAAPSNNKQFHTYTVDWTAERIVWLIDGTPVRTLKAAEAGSYGYPQTPMMIRVGVWAGGDPNNAQGTIDWAGGLTNYNDGPFTMYCKSIKVTDYSTGKEYRYTDKSGTWESIEAVGGSVGGNQDAAESVSTDASAPTITSGSSAPFPFSGTHRDPETWTKPDVWPWVPSASASLTDHVTSQWSTDAGSATTPPAASSTSLPSAPASCSSAGSPCPSGDESSSSGAQPTTLTTATSETSAGGSAPTDTGSSGSDSGSGSGSGSAAGSSDSDSADGNGDSGSSAAPPENFSDDSNRLTMSMTMILGIFAWAALLMA
ncbi:hypothetical protein VTN49DRAFT_5513 [Thermomyces lanuginosus]|uniref:uncharacterized protein n=1 Tax=Thermomyces lanuginosus TaxID=5541 RepID=UPI003742683B